MKNLIALPLLLAALLLGGCGPDTRGGRFVQVITTTIENPVKPQNVYQVRLAFLATVKVANEWASYCWSGRYKVLMADPVASRVCVNRRQTRRALIAAADRTSAVINASAKFIRNNPTLSPLAAIDGAWTAVTEYQSTVARLSNP